MWQNAYWTRKAAKWEVPSLEKEHTAHDKRVCEFKMSVLMKLERALEDNLCNLIAVLMSLCDSDIKIQWESMNEFSDLEKKMDSIGLVNLIKTGVHSRY